MYPFNILKGYIFYYLQFYSNYKIDFDCIGVDNITDVLVEPIVLILSITLSNSYISFTITLSKEQSSPVI